MYLSGLQWAVQLQVVEHLIGDICVWYDNFTTINGQKQLGGESGVYLHILRGWQRGVQTHVFPS